MKLGTNDIGSVYLGTNAVQKVYLGTNEVWSAFDADYKAVLDYATTKGYTLPSASQQALQNQLLVDLKDAGIWSKLDTFAVFATDAEDSPGSGTSNFALIDWKRLSDYNPVNSPTFATNQGFTGNGSSSYIDTNYNPNTNKVNLTINSASIGFWQRSSSVAQNSVEIGTDDGTYRFQCLSRWSDSNSYLPIFTSNFPSVTASTSVGLFQNNRINSTTINQYVNGVKNGSDQSDTSNTIPSRNITVLARNAPTIFGYSNRQLSMSFIGSNLESESTDFYNIYNTYMTSL
jgi:hypothetical protein